MMDKFNRTGSPITGFFKPTVLPNINSVFVREKNHCGETVGSATAGHLAAQELRLQSYRSRSAQPRPDDHLRGGCIDFFDARFQEPNITVSFFGGLITHIVGILSILPITPITIRYL